MRLREVTWGYMRLHDVLSQNDVFGFTSLNNILTTLKIMFCLKKMLPLLLFPLKTDPYFTIL